MPRSSIEDAPARPESPYGQTKVASEWLLRAVALAHPAAAPVVAALLQRGRFGDARTGRPQPAQPVPAGAQGDHGRCARRSCSAPTTRRPTAPACATTCTSPTSPTRTCGSRTQLDAGARCRAGLQRRTGRRLERARGARRDAGGDRHRLRRSTSARAARATRPASSARSSGSPPISTGTPATTSPTWSTAPGRPGSSSSPTTEAHRHEHLDLRGRRHRLDRPGSGRGGPDPLGLRAALRRRALARGRRSRDGLGRCRDRGARPRFGRRRSRRRSATSTC